DIDAYLKAHPIKRRARSAIQVAPEKPAAQDPDELEAELCRKLGVVRVTKSKFPVMKSKS
ncbi:MAG TPA: hypothetical protein VNO75_09220, partial [Gemmatimonadaceae bacterium]|nr:hypothetical protein [Gemmatimonadaceae bacterium]